MRGSVVLPFMVNRHKEVKYGTTYGNGEIYGH